MNQDNPTVTSFLAADHQRLERILAEADRLAAGAHFDDALEQFAEYQAGLEHHLTMEERVLFASFERDCAGPTVMLRNEHEQIRALLADAAHAIEVHDEEGFGDARTALAALLAEHSAREDRTLYTMIDRASEPERAALVRQMSAVR